MSRPRRTHVDTVSGTDGTVGRGAREARQDWALDRRWAVDASGVLALVAGGVLTMVGLIALVDLGVGDFPSSVRTEFLGLGLTQVWAVGSIVVGLLFLGGVGGYGRSLITLAGAVAVVAGIVAISAHERLDPTLAASTSYGWLCLVVGGVVLLGAIAVPTAEAQRRERVVDRRSGAFDG